jgi:hypothetical protein
MYDCDEICYQEYDTGYFDDDDLDFCLRQCED